ncbi:MAG: AmmeMemoRadiSam system protein A [Clostridiales bacterium]|jgi:AmmeMemoRadiSam system protein A|nr:AmmeMemoRadiSam system protein A [Eubacteriales bacterium]MDH7565978.1 AmmeMemoRadiSam system protein A [Clostridiales bacterium]
MGRIISSYIFPHPPVIIPEVGKGEEKGAEETIEAAKKAAAEIGREKPTTIIVTTSHGPIFQDYIFISASNPLAGDFGRFGSSHVRMEFTNNIELVNKITAHAREQGIFSGDLEDSLARRYKISRELDHGTLVPLYFVKKEYGDFKLVHISIAGLPFQDLYRYGMCIARAVEESEERVVFLASGDMSHRLSYDGPYGYSEKGKEFDDLLIRSFKSANVEALLDIDENFCESAGECGLRSFIIMFGALDGFDLEPRVYSYQGPFGVGYSVARFGVGAVNPKRRILKKMEERNRRGMQQIRENEDPYVKLARHALESYIRDKRVIRVPDGLPEEMVKNTAGTFVSIKKNGRLRGCIGTIRPTRENIAEEIIYNAISSGSKDPRFNPVEEEELEKLVYSVDVLKEPEPIESIDELDVIKYGVIVKSGTRSGLLLPNLEGVDTPEKQVSIALQKAGIRAHEKFSMERFEVVRHR